MFSQPAPAILMLNIHYTRVSDLAMPDNIIVSPSVPISGYRDGFVVYRRAKAALHSKIRDLRFCQRLPYELAATCRAIG